MAGVKDDGDDGEEEEVDGVAHARLLLPAVLLAQAEEYQDRLQALCCCCYLERRTAPAAGGLPNCPASRPLPATSK